MSDQETRDEGDAVPGSVEIDPDPEPENPNLASPSRDSPSAVEQNQTTAGPTENPQGNDETPVQEVNTSSAGDSRSEEDSSDRNPSGSRVNLSPGGSRPRSQVASVQAGRTTNSEDNPTTSNSYGSTQENDVPQTQTQLGVTRPKSQEEKLPATLNPAEEEEEEEFNLMFASPYTYRPPSQISFDSQTDDPVNYDDDLYSSSGDPNGAIDPEDPPPIISLPPPSFKKRFVTRVNPIIQETEVVDKQDLRTNKPNSWRDKRTLFGAVLLKTTYKKQQSLLYEENKKQLKNGAKLATKIAKIPLNSCWHISTQAFFYALFLTNIIVAIYDIQDTDDTRVAIYTYKISALTLSVVENILVFAVVIYVKCSKRSHTEDFKKKQQYIENIAHEVLLYPIVIMSVLGFSTEQGWSVRDNAFGAVQLVLLILDLADLIWAQGNRMLILYKLMKDIRNHIFSNQEDGDQVSQAESAELPPEVKTGWGTSPEKHVKRTQSNITTDKRKGPAGFSFAGYLLPRTFITVLGNAVMFMYLIFMLLLQFVQENHGKGLYLPEYGGGILMTCLVIFPLLSLVVFFVSNSYWLLEVLILINLSVSSNDHIQRDMQNKFGGTLSDAIKFAADKSSETKRQLDEIQLLPTWQKVLYGVGEPWIVAILMLWEGFFLASILSFNGFKKPVFDYDGVIKDGDTLYIQMGLVLICLVANHHVILLCLVLHVVVIPMVLIGILVYPFSILACFSVKDKIKKDNRERILQRRKEREAGVSFA